VAYGEAARPLANKYGVRVRYLGGVAATVIGNDEWDLVALVDYPSAQAGHDMVTDPEYPLQMRADARVDSRLYCTRPV
jgi:uncharacterized protein (DUF1330 family)